MARVALKARELDCVAMQWLVAPWNSDAIRFYEKLGARQNQEWLNFEMNEEVMARLSNAQ